MPIVLVFLFESCTNSEFEWTTRNFFGNFGSKNFREMLSLTIDLSLSDWFLRVTVKSQIGFCLASSLNCWVCSDSCGINLPRYAIMPKKRCKSCTDFGKGKLLIALTLSRSGEIPFPDILCPKNFSSVAPKEHLPLFSFKPDFPILFKTCSVRTSYWFRVDPHMVISSPLFLAPSQPSIISFMSCWKTSPVLCIL